jgi:hypothetical protein
LRHNLLLGLCTLLKLDLKLFANWNIRLYHYPRFALGIPEDDNTHEFDERGKAQSKLSHQR